MKIPFLTSIWNWLKGASKKVKEALNFGNEVANSIKKVADSPLLDVAVNLTATKIDNVALTYIRTGLKVFIEAMGWAEKKVSDFDDKTLPHVMNSINAEASFLKAEFDRVDLSRPQAIASAQIVYQPKIVE